MNILKGVGTLLVLDFLWIFLFMGRKYSGLVSDIQGRQLSFNPYWALFAYGLMVLGLIFFVLPGIRHETRLEDSLRYGALFGFVVYGVYDATCGAIFAKWDIGLAILDILWGAFVYFSAAYVSSVV